MPDISDVPCRSCQAGYGGPHPCDIPDYCPCDQTHLHKGTGLKTVPDELVEKAVWYARATGVTVGKGQARAVLEAVWPDLVSGEGVDPFSKVSNIDFDDEEEQDEQDG